jgi:twitching motility protein PilI
MSVDEPSDSSDSAEPFDAFVQLARDCAGRQRQQTIGEVPPEPRQTVLFRVGRYRLLAPIDSVAEVLEFPTTFAEVPGTCDWVVGIANHRGELLPLFDLRALLLTAEAGEPESVPMEGRILVPRGCRSSFGLLVEEVIGMRTLHQPQEAPDEDLPEALGSIVQGVVGEGSNALPMVDLTRVEALPAFRAMPVSNHRRP